MSDLGGYFLDLTTPWSRSDVVVGYTSHYKTNKIILCHNITPNREGIGRPNWAQIEAELCVSDLRGLFFIHLTTGWHRSDVVVDYTSLV